MFSVLDFYWINGIKALKGLSSVLIYDGVKEYLRINEWSICYNNGILMRALDLVR